MPSASMIIAMGLSAPRAMRRASQRLPSLALQIAVSSPIHAAEALAMERALVLAAAAAAAGEVPIGAVVLDVGGRVVGEAANATVARRDALCHAEVLALTAAARALGVARLDGCVLVTTVEPCVHCYGAAALHHVARVVYGAPSPKFGARTSGAIAAAHATNHAVELVVAPAGGDRAAELLRAFFAGKRGLGVSLLRGSGRDTPTRAVGDQLPPLCAEPQPQPRLATPGTS